MTIPAIPNSNKAVPLALFSVAGNNTFSTATGWFILDCNTSNPSQEQFSDTVRIIGELNPKANTPIEADNRPLPLIWHFFGNLFGKATVELNFPDCPKNIPQEKTIPPDPQADPIAQAPKQPAIQDFDECVSRAGILEDFFPMPVIVASPIQASPSIAPVPISVPPRPIVHSSSKPARPVKGVAIASSPVPRPSPAPEIVPVPAPALVPAAAPIPAPPPPESGSAAPDAPGEPVKKPKRRLF
ncbi:MAG: hypothetical protein WCV91_05800 [Candidatus Margulisiibacteriota bacterium]